MALLKAFFTIGGVTDKQWFASFVKKANGRLDTKRNARNYTLYEW